MAIKTFNLSWMRQYRVDSNSYVGSNSPIRVGGTQGYHSYLGFPPAVREALQESKTTPQLRLKFYVTDSTPEWDIGRHKLYGSAEPTYTTMPWYNYLKPAQGYGSGWLSFNLTSDFMNDYKNGTYQGIVLYSAQAVSYYGEATNTGSNRAYIEVTGTWNDPPSAPNVTYPSGGETVDKSITVRWSPASDPDGNALRYQVAYRSGSSSGGYNYAPLTNYGATSLTVDTSSLSEGSYAQIAVRSYDGEFYSDWDYSPRFTINHNNTPSAPTQLSPNGSIKDRNEVIRFSWKHNDDGAQAGYRIAWRTVSSTGVRGAWNYRPSSTGFVSGTNQYYDWAPLTFPNSDIEWTVKTKDQQGLSSGYSTYTIFKSRDETTVPTFLTPSFNEVISTTRVTASWSSLNQQEYNLILKDDSGVTLWSTTEVSTEKFIEIPYDLVNNSGYSLSLRVKDSVNLLWSEYVDQPFSTMFDPPQNPIVIGTEELGDGVLNIMYSTTDENVTPSFVLGSGEVNPRIEPYGTTSFETNVTINSDNSIQLSGVSKGIEWTYSALEVPLNAGEIYKLSAYFSKQGAMISLEAYDDGMVLLDSDSTSDSTFTSVTGFNTVQLTLPSNTTYLRAVVRSTSNNINTIDVTNIRLNQLVILTADFVGKVQGSNTVNPHIALANGASTEMQTPSGAWSEFVTSSAPAYSYAEIATLDSSTCTLYASGDDADPRFAQEAFGFNLIRLFEDEYGPIPATANDSQKIEWLKKHIKVIRFNSWSTAYGQVGPVANDDLYTAGVWNGTEWEDLAIHVQSVPTKTTIELDTDYIQSGDYIGTDGLMYFHHYAPPSSNSSISALETDYINLEVEWYEVNGGYDGVIPNGIDVYRRPYTPSNTEDWKMIAKGLDTKGSFIDYTLANGVTYEYRLRATSENSTSAYSDSVTAVLHFENTLLQSAQDIANILPIEMVTVRDTKRTIDSELRKFAGRQRPVREFGENSEVELSLTWEVDSFQELEKFEQLIESRSTLLYRDYNGRRMWVTTGDLDVEDKEIVGFVLSTKLVETNYNEDLEFENEELI